MKGLRDRSLIRQTIGIVLAAQLTCALVLCSAALLYERHTRLRALDIRLQGRSDSLLGAIQDAEDPDDNVVVDPAELDLPGDDIYAVYNSGGRLVGSSRDASPLIIQRHSDGFREMKLGRRNYRVIQREAMRVIDRAENGGVGLKRPVTIVYASSVGKLWHEIFEAVRFYLLAIAFATGITVVAMALLLKRALFPLSELVAAAKQLSPPAMVFVAPASVMQMRELRPLAEVLTDAVGRLREAFAKEQRFVGDAAHELKTAIAVVRSSVQLLMLKPRTIEEYAGGLRRVLEDNSRVETLVTQMLQLASMEEASCANAPATDLGHLTAVALEQLRPISEERRIALNFTSSELCKVRIMPERSLTLVSNLVMNAIQHSRSGQAVSISVCGNGPGNVALHVEDVGTGIDAGAIPHIFERFYREDRSRSRETGGTGLGLSICKSIVEAAGGSISVKSAPERGTRVTVTFIAA